MTNILLRLSHANDQRFFAYVFMTLKIFLGFESQECDEWYNKEEEILLKNDVIAKQ